MVESGQLPSGVFQKNRAYIKLGEKTCKRIASTSVMPSLSNYTNGHNNGILSTVQSSSQFTSPFVPGKVTVILGGQWGDEGKGKFSDYMSRFLPPTVYVVD